MTQTTTYDIIRNRLQQQADELRTRLQQLNTARKDVFGAVESALIANDRITTGNYCTARDIVAVGEHCILGYNVHLGLRSGIQLTDVFSIYRFHGKGFEEAGLSLLQKEEFQTDFHNLYRYYKEAYFARFAQRGRHLYMIFHLKPGGTDFKAFKWLRTDEGLQYVDNRSDQEVRFPNQYEFRWQQAGRDEQRHGRHPHVSILDRVFVETTGGDLTIKVEDNTNDGRGIYTEPVEYKDQTLDDAEFAYADLGHLIALRIKPYQEDYRYFVFNEKMQSVERVAALADSGVLLPDQQGLIFANGYYLQTGEYKLFDHSPTGLLFKKRIASPNGEDFLFVFYRADSGTYLLLHYNIINQEVATPIVCNGFTLFPNGELAYFKAEEEPTKHHVLQIWQTPFLEGEVIPSEHTDAYLYKVGNKDIVRAMAECQEILTLTGKEDAYANLYDELVKRTTDVLDRYYWIDQPDAFQLDAPLKALRQTANTAIEEYEKKVSAQRRDQVEMQRVEKEAQARFDAIRRASFDRIEDFVANLAGLRAIRGDIAGLRELRYADIEQVDALEEQAQKAQSQLAEDCVAFLLEEDALLPYRKQIEAEAARIPQLETARQAAELEAAFDEIGKALELLIEIVSNLKIEDATQTTRIIDGISALFTLLNQHKAAVKQRGKQFRTQESKAEFDAQLKLLDQSIINYLDLADTPEKCDDYLTKLMVQLEELEGKFAEVDAFVTELSVKREEVYAALESRKNSLVEARNSRTANLAKAADRILSGMQKRAAAFKEEAEVNSFFAADLMVEKVRDLIRQLQELDDSNKANAVQTQLKTLKEDTLRSLRDRKELFEEGENIIRLGQHRFSVNVQPLELTVVHDDGQLLYHLTGTNFYEPIEDEVLLHTQAVWQQSLISENPEVCRSEYLAYQLYREHPDWPVKTAALLPLVTKAAGQRYAEGYTKGIHDADATIMLSTLLEMSQGISLLRFPPTVRACAKSWWTAFVETDRKALFQKQLKSAGEILELFPNTREFDYLIEELAEDLQAFVDHTRLFPAFTVERAAEYLFHELAQDDHFVISAEAGQLYRQFVDLLSGKKALKRFKQSLDALRERPRERYLLIRKWVHAFLEEQGEAQWLPYQEEIAALLFADDFEKTRVIELQTSRQLEGLRSDHPVLKEGRYELNFHAFMDKLERYCGETVPLFEQFQSRKRTITAEAKEALQLDNFKPRVMSSFVRNRLIDKVYLPLFGDNLAKQMGTAGEQTRTDRMGLLLLLSPPGYGKTTLMEYIANRLGLIFMKINGPAIGHQVTSLAPQDANSMAAAKELEKLNLALEMGDNIMLYVDDIQHCHPEFLQKFISLCDAQRRIEGVYKGKAKTYDLRGSRFAVVMAGNPYTESGDRFQIPDMLANRADIYNLGDIIGDSAAAFKLSYLENALTSNSTLAQLAGRSMKDVHMLIQSVETGQLEGLEYEGSHSAQELADYRKVLQLLLKVRDVVLTVNQAYIRSAAMAEDYRTEPAFKLQGSYRNMNKLAEKIAPIMNESELRTLLLAHYEGEVQTLTADAEANFLKLKELLGWLSPEEAARWSAIKTAFQKKQRFGGADGSDRMAQVIAQMDAFNEGLSGIRRALEAE
jgi:hypothetical protein